MTTDERVKITCTEGAAYAQITYPLELTDLPATWRGAVS